MIHPQAILMFVPGGSRRKAEASGIDRHRRPWDAPVCGLRRPRARRRIGHHCRCSTIPRKPAQPTVRRRRDATLAARGGRGVSVYALARRAAKALPRVTERRATKRPVPGVRRPHVLERVRRGGRRAARAGIDPAGGGDVFGGGVVAMSPAASCRSHRSRHRTARAAPLPRRPPRRTPDHARCTPRRRSRPLRLRTDINVQRPGVTAPPPSVRHGCRRGDRRALA